ncbi:MAG: hypothetical protein ACIAQU_04220 [Phycisphaerales bacterium JB064]
MTTTPEAQIALDRNETSADALIDRHFCRDYGRASRREKAKGIGRYVLGDGTHVLVYTSGHLRILCLPEEPFCA